MALFPFAQRVVARLTNGTGPAATPPPAAPRDTSLKIAFDAATVGLAVTTIDGHWLHVNEACCQLLGYTRDELIRFSLNDLTHPEDAKKELAFIRRVLAGDAQRYRIEKRMMNKRGAYRALVVSASLTERPKPQPAVLTYVIEEPGARTESGHDAGRLATAILEQIHSAAVIRCDARGNITGWNRGAERIFGYRREEIIGKSRRTLYRDEDNWEDRPLTHMRMAAEHGPQALDDFRVARDGKQLWLRCELTPYAPDGIVRGYVEVLSLPDDAVQTVDVRPALEKLRQELDQQRTEAIALRDENQQLKLEAERSEQELRALARALRREIDANREVGEAAESSALDSANEPEWTPLRGKSPLHLLNELANARRTGTLLLADGNARKAIFLEDGRLMSIASNDPHEFLAERLIRTGRITDAQRNKARTLAEATGLALGRCLIILGVMDDDSLRDAMRAKIEDEIDAIAYWHDCHYAFVQRPLPHRKMLPVRMVVRDLRAIATSGENFVDITPEPEAPRFLATARGTRYHVPSCKTLARVAESQRIAVRDAIDAASRHLSPCRVCAAGESATS